MQDYRCGGGRTRFVAVLYVNRSGSTLFSRLASERFPDACVFPEVSFPIHLLAERSRGRSRSGSALHDLINSDPRIAALGISDAELKTVCAAHSSDDLPALFDALAAASRGGRAHRLVMFKLETLLDMSGQLLASFPGIKFIHVVRDPRAVASSMLRTPVPEKPGFDMARGSIVHAANHWHRYIRRVDELARIAPVATVQYEEFGRDFAAVAARLEPLLDLAPEEPSSEPRPSSYATAPIDAALHANIHKPFMSERIEGWSAELSQRDILVIETICREEMDRLGYVPVRPVIANGRFAMPMARARHVGLTIRHAALTLRHYLRRKDALKALAQRGHLTVARYITRRRAS